MTSSTQHSEDTARASHQGHAAGSRRDDAGRGDHAARFRDRLWLSVALTIPW
jgi:hypothetical protein